jgi:hypothetical protein
MKKGLFRPTRRIPRLEVLEDRTLLSGNVTATLNVNTGVLSIVGDIGNNNIQLTQINPFGVAEIRVAGVLSIPAAPPFAPDFTSVNAVSFTDFTLSSITSMNIDFTQGGNDKVVMGTPVTGFTLPNNITISQNSAANPGTGTYTLNNITANKISIANTGGKNTVTLNTVQAGSLAVTEGGGADTVTLNGDVVGTATINTGGGGDTVTIVNSPVGGPPANRPAFGVLTVNTGDAPAGGTNTIAMTGSSAGILSFTEGAGTTNHVTLTNSLVSVSAFIKTGLVVNSADGKIIANDSVDVEGDTFKGSAGLVISQDATAVAPAGAVHTTTIDDDTFTASGALNVTVGDGVQYFINSGDHTGTLIPALESHFFASDLTGIGTASISLGKYITFVTVGAFDDTPVSANALTLTVGDNPMTIVVNTVIAKNESITIGSAADAGSPAFTTTLAGTVGGNETVTVGNGFGNFTDSTNVGKAAAGNTPASGNQTITLGNGNGNITITGFVGGNQTVTVGNGTGTITITGGTTNEIFSFGGGHGTITLGGNAASLTITLGDGATVVVSTVVTGQETITGGNNDNVTVAETTVGALAINLGSGATILVQDVVTTGGGSTSGDIVISVIDNTASVAVIGSTSNNLTITANNGIGGTGSSLFYLNGDTVNGSLTLTAAGGNNTVSLVSLLIQLGLNVALGPGINTVFAQAVTALFGQIDGGSGGSSTYFDLGGNSGFSQTGFSGYF